MKDNEELKELHPTGLNIIQNPDGSYCFEWNPDDPRWDWMNDLTDDQIRSIMEQLALQETEK
jgi:hypothetical protein